METMEDVHAKLTAKRQHFLANKNGHDRNEQQQQQQTPGRRKQQRGELPASHMQAKK